MSYQEPQITAQDALAKLGLGTPPSRAFVIGVLAASALYLSGIPKSAFREDGSIRPFAPLTPGPDGVNCHFLVCPLAIASAAFLFT